MNHRTAAPTAAQRLLTAFEGVMGIPLPVHVRCWDGSEAGPESNVTVVFRNRRAIRRVLWSPNELGLVRAYVAGDLEIEGDVFHLLALPDLVGRLEALSLRGTERRTVVRALPTFVRHGGHRTIARSLATFVRLGGLGLPPRPPSVEVPRRRGTKHSKERDASSVSHHYDVGNDFYRLFLGPTMVYSCGYWDQRPEDPDARGSLNEAQIDKLDLVCRKLRLESGMRLLDVGCGWGSMAIHAAQKYNVSVVGVTLSHEQARWARSRVAEAGLSDQVEIRVQDYRDVTDGPYDVISSIGMSEHVGASALPGYAEQLFDLLRPRGLLLNHAIASVRSRADAGYSPGLIENYIFPDGEVLPLSRTIDAFERAGLEVRDTEALREHYALTLRAWVDRLRGSWDHAVELVGAERARTWLLYLAASALGFEEKGRLTIHQVLAVRPSDDGGSGLPRTRAMWLGADNAPRNCS
ncbi:cyclopropane-fatty-acyl-phospholipid synthase [Rhodococcus sp. WMMA185]|uniref:class I SAM-dependent methyltransferase n=1 Tax=Rhodococcus sp. WMMA185 TaxID=679318 RepID=UPI000878C210|nr:class I SAM-dependent methyltransferase [Rhodococcus sp. WMMA185]AOW93422.1 cyclopropane-fatty-acyl-phospholipid synthase [Rhodococcus sp. WMMA185]